MVQELSKRGLWAALIFLFTGLGAVGFQMRGALLPRLQQTFSVSPSLLGLVAPTGSAGFMISLLIMGMRAGRVDLKKFLLIGILFTSACMLLMSASLSFFLFLGFLLGRTLASGIFRGLDRAVLSHLFPKRHGWIFNLHALAWAVGATAGPLLVNLILSFGSWRLAYFLLAFTFIPLFVLLSKIELPSSIKREKALSAKGLKEILKNPAIAGATGALILNGGVEGGFFTWLPYFANQFFPLMIANLALSGFLGAYIPGRYLWARLSGKIGYLNLVLINSVASVFLLLGAFVLTSGVLMLACIFAAGFSVSSIFPTLLSFEIDIFPQYSGPINALTLSSANIGISTFPALIGLITDWYWIGAGMKLLIFLMAGIAAVVFVTKTL